MRPCVACSWWAVAPAGCSDGSTHLLSVETAAAALRWVLHAMAQVVIEILNTTPQAVTATPAGIALRGLVAVAVPAAICCLSGSAADCLSAECCCRD